MKAVELCRVCCLVSLGVALWAADVTAGWAEDPPSVVRLVVDYGDGVEKHFTRLRWQEGITVLQVLQAAAAHRHGIQFQHRGRGATAFVTQIDDLENQGQQRNWVYRVNDKLADRSCGIQTLKPGDTVLWKFGEYR